jgi:hypothetical protein
VVAGGGLVVLFDEFELLSGLVSQFVSPELQGEVVVVCAVTATAPNSRPAVTAPTNERFFLAFIFDLQKGRGPGWSRW